jgi:hypothetical protein
MKAENRLFVSTQFLARHALPAKAGALVLPLLLGLAACGGSSSSTPPPETPIAQPSAANEAPPAEKPTAALDKASSPAPSLAAATTPMSGASTSSSSTSSSSSSATPAKIEFPPHATVDQAIKAIPQGTPRTNMADEALRSPLLDLKRYDKCKVPHSTKVTMSVAVYDGVAVGTDISSKPKNAKIEECVDGVVRSMTWSKVPSLNTVTASF